MSRQPPFQRILFDCDSTLSTIEGIDELAVGHGPEVQRLTNDAMEGRLSMEEVYARRLEILAPAESAVQQLVGKYVECAVPRVREVMGFLENQGKEVHVVSGGLLPAVAGFAAWLGIPAERVHAVDLKFDAQGRYLDFDRESLLATQNGKQELAKQLPPQRTALVGDGSTDAIARDVVDCFVCFAGVVERPRVAAEADRVVRGSSFEAVLSAICTEEECREWKQL